jgi:hypothetical protein
MFQIRFMCSIGQFGAKTADFWRKYVNILQVNSRFFLITNNPCLQQRIISTSQYSEILWKCYKMSYVCTLTQGALWKYFGTKSWDFLEKSPNIGKKCIIILFSPVS